MKAFKHIESGRYLVGFTKKKEAETTKQVTDAMTWDVKVLYRRHNYLRFIRSHEPELKNFIEVDI